MKRLWFVYLALHVASPDFVYPDFNDTTSLRLNGDAATSSCNDGGAYVYATAPAAPGLGANDAFDGSAGNGGAAAVVLTEGTTTRAISESTTLDEAHGVLSNARFEAAFPARDAYAAAPLGGCPVRLRLTPSRPFKVGSIARVTPEAVFNGWETGFTFQVTDPSRQCTSVKDAAFGTASHRTCTVAGADGLAFVIHSDGNGSAAIGAGGGGMGYAGLRNALALEFDTWYNTGSGTDDLPFDHTTLQASPPRRGNSGDDAGTPFVTSGPDTRLNGAPIRVPIGDGLVHSVRIAYYPYIRHDFVRSFSASPLLPAVLTTDAANGRGIGTLAVWVDVIDPGTGKRLGSSPQPLRGATSSTIPEPLPTFAVPFTLSTLLTLPSDAAWVGFTAATGSSAWQKHDVLSWYWCGGGVGCAGLVPKVGIYSGGDNPTDDGVVYGSTGS